jgi:hypothetical protein
VWFLGVLHRELIYRDRRYQCARLSIPQEDDDILTVSDIAIVSNFTISLDDGSRDFGLDIMELVWFLKDYSLASELGRRGLRNQEAKVGGREKPKELATSEIERLRHQSREVRQPEARKEQFKSVWKSTAYVVIVVCLSCMVSREYRVNCIVDCIHDFRHVALFCQCNFVSRLTIQQTLSSVQLLLAFFHFFPTFIFFFLQFYVFFPPSHYIFDTCVTIFLPCLSPFNVLLFFFPLMKPSRSYFLVFSVLNVIFVFGSFFSSLLLLFKILCFIFFFPPCFFFLHFFLHFFVLLLGFYS